MKLVVSNCIFDYASIDSECRMNCRDLDRVEKFRVYIFLAVKYITCIDVLGIIFKHIYYNTVRPK